VLQKQPFFKSAHRWGPQGKVERPDYIARLTARMPLRQSRSKAFGRSPAQPAPRGEDNESIGVWVSASVRIVYNPTPSISEVLCDSSLVSLEAVHHVGHSAIFREA
jgi:hypothetical protein